MAQLLQTFSSSDWLARKDPVVLAVFDQSKLCIQLVYVDVSR